MLRSATGLWPPPRDPSGPGATWATLEGRPERAAEYIRGPDRRSPGAALSPPGGLSSLPRAASLDRPVMQLLRWKNFPALRRLEGSGVAFRFAKSKAETTVR